MVINHLQVLGWPSKYYPTLSSLKGAALSPPDAARSQRAWTAKRSTKPRRHQRPWREKVANTGGGVEFGMDMFSML